MKNQWGKVSITPLLSMPLTSCKIVENPWAKGKLHNPLLKTLEIEKLSFHEHGLDYPPINLSRLYYG